MKIVRAPLLALWLALPACAGGATPSPQPPPAAAGAVPEAPKTVKTLEGIIVTYQSGAEVGREHFHDDGERLISTLTLGGHEAIVTVTRTPRHATVEADGKTVERDVDDHTIVLANGSWQALALAAAWFPSASTPTPVTVLVPGRGARVDGTLAVTPSPAGGRLVKVVVAGTVVTAEIDAGGTVIRAEVPAQGVEARPEGQPPPVVVDQLVPDGIAAEPFETSGVVPLRGDLWRPARATGKVPVVVMIAGSGPTDRDGNSRLGASSAPLRKLAEALAGRGVASLRYDKRGLGKSGTAFDPAQITLDDFVSDAAAVVQKVAADPRLGPVSVLGHSEGGLIALKLAQKTPLGTLVLVATAGRPLAAVLREQLARQLDGQGLVELDRIFAGVRSGQPIDPLQPPFDGMFPQAVRGFLRSELDVDPVPLLRALKVPTAIIQGDSDAQVTVTDARLLAAARPDAKLTVVTRMSHMFRDEASTRLPQASYTDPTLPLSPGFADAVVAAIAGARR